MSHENSWREAEMCGQTQSLPRSRVRKSLSYLLPSHAEMSRGTAQCGKSPSPRAAGGCCSAEKSPFSGSWFSPFQSTKPRGSDASRTDGEPRIGSGCPFPSQHGALLVQRQTGEALLRAMRRAKCLRWPGSCKRAGWAQTSPKPQRSTRLL